MQLDAQHQTLRAEADHLLSSGLRAVLEGLGDVHVVGSYSLGLMVWRDLDIHVVRPQPGEREFFALGGRIAELVRPARMHFRDERVMRTAGLPRGLYWGVYLGDERKAAWKIDIWTTGEEEFETTRRVENRIRQALTEDIRHAILAIKSRVWQHSEYRRGFSSADVYEAVIDAGVRDVDGFFARLTHQGKQKTA